MLAVNGDYLCMLAVNRDSLCVLAVNKDDLDGQVPRLSTLPTRPLLSGIHGSIFAM